MFKPDYRNLEDCARNKNPARIPLYEHNVDPGVAERITGQPFVHCYFDEKPDYETFFRHFCGFFRDYGYDAVSYECCITLILPDGGALNNLRPGVIQSAGDFEKYPFDRVPQIFIDTFKPKLDALKKVMPDGMKAVGGVGNGVFEIAEDLVGYENLCLLSYDDPDLYAALFARIGRMMKEIWSWFLDEYADLYCVCRFGSTP